MARYARKDTTVKAEQFFSDKLPWPGGVQLKDVRPVVYCTDYSMSSWYPLQDGDWVLNSFGYRYRMCDSDFQQLYEPMSRSEARSEFTH